MITKFKTKNYDKKRNVFYSTNFIIESRLAKCYNIESKIESIISQRELNKVKKK